MTRMSGSSEMSRFSPARKIVWSSTSSRSIIALALWLVQRHAQEDHGSLVAASRDLQRSTDFARAFGHADQADSTATHRFSVDATPVVLQLHLQAVVQPVQSHIHRAGFGVTRHIRQRLLKNSVALDRAVRREAGLDAVHRERRYDTVPGTESLQRVLDGGDESHRV